MAVDPSTGKNSQSTDVNNAAMQAPAQPNTPMRNYDRAAKTDMGGTSYMSGSATNGRDQLGPKGNVTVQHAGRLSPGKDKS